VIDEPTLGVDVEARHAIWSHLRLLKAGGTSIIVSTNYLDEALALCDTVAVLRSGKVLTAESPQALVARAGTCLDLECDPQGRGAIEQLLAKMEGILRVQPTPAGFFIFLASHIAPEDVLSKIFPLTTVNSFRLRGADLAEIFRVLDEATA